jgi:GxxExxY protein
LGPGLLETVYQSVLAYELEERGFRVQREVPISVVYEGLRFDVGFKAHLLIDGLVIVELKSVEHTAPVHEKQVLTYVRLANLRLGLLIDFGAPLIKAGITRVANGLPN